MLVYANKNAKAAENFAINLAKVAMSVGFQILKPKMLELVDDG
jgi:hypothetical protein